MKKLIFFTSAHAPFIKQFQDSVKETNPDWECIKLPATDRTVEFNVGVATHPGDPGDVLLFCDDDIIWTGKIKVPGPFFSAGILPILHHHVAGEGWMLMPCETADGYAIGCTRGIFDAVGGFDEGYKYSGFQDSDFTLKCRQVGVELTEWELPGVHLGAGTKYQINPNHPVTRKANLARFRHKWNLPVITEGERQLYNASNPKWTDEELWEKYS